MAQQAKRCSQHMTPQHAAPPFIDMLQIRLH
jgi:hypothetical protein